MSLVSLEDDNYFCIGCLVEIELTQEFKNNLKSQLNAQKEQKTESKHPEATNASNQYDELEIFQDKQGYSEILHDEPYAYQNPKLILLFEEEMLYEQFFQIQEQEIQQMQASLSHLQSAQVSPISKINSDSQFFDYSFYDTQSSLNTTQSINQGKKKIVPQKYKDAVYIKFFSLITNKVTLDKMNCYPQVKLIRLKSGKGMIISKEGSIYGGEWKDGKLSGTGLLIYLSGDVYDGQWTNGLRNGSGTYYYKDGGSYIGKWVLGFMHGQGVLTWQNGDQYTGQFVYNQRSGNGELKCANGDKYIGEFEMNKINGQGVYSWIDGGSYQGTFKNGQFHGQGILNYNNGDIYMGDFIDGKRQGKGVLTPQIGLKYSGNWKNDEKSDDCSIF
eukprot:403338314